MQNFFPFSVLNDNTSENRNVIYSTSESKRCTTEGILPKTGEKHCNIWLWFLKFVKLAENKEHFRNILLLYFRETDMLHGHKRRYVLCMVRVPLMIPSAKSISHSFAKTILIAAIHQVPGNRLNLMTTKYFARIKSYRLEKLKI